MVNIVRNKGNWEAKFTNITYEQAKEIANHKNVKEISVYRREGISEPIYSNEIITISLDIRAYDNKLIKNSNMKLIEGRFPQKTNEIIVAVHESYMMEGIPKNVNDKVIITVNGKEKEYTVVGVVDKIEFDNLSITGGEFGVITYFDEDILKNDSIVSVTIITENIQKIYDTTMELSKILNIQKETKEENKTEEEILKEMLLR